MTTGSLDRSVSYLSAKDQSFSTRKIILMCDKMLKKSYHPKAHLQKTKNIRSGLGTRTKILDFLDLRLSDAGTIAKETSLSYNVVLHHLWLLEAEGKVTRKGRRPFSWVLTGIGQKRLIT